MKPRLPRDASRPKVDYFEAMSGSIEVLSWHPTPEPTGLPTQVHLRFPLGDAKVVFRFKGPGTLDNLIAALVDHRRDVFGEPGAPSANESEREPPR